MAAATNAQVQTYANERTRPRAEQSRSLLLALESDKAAFDDIYQNLISNPTWTDSNNGNPPHLLTPDDLLAINTFGSQLIAIMRGTLASDAAKVTAVNDVAAQLPIVLKACVRAVNA